MKKKSYKDAEFKCLEVLAKNNGMTLRRANESGCLPMTFEVVYRGARRDSVALIPDILVGAIWNMEPVKHGLNIEEVILKYSTVK